MSRPQDTAELVKCADEFGLTLEGVKNRIHPRSFEWYPYSSLSNLRTLDRLLTGPSRFLLNLAGGKPVLDVGCADGDLSFFFESLGCRVQAIDNPVTNYNAMRAVQALKTELRSDVEIHSMDLDGQFLLPHNQYGLVLLLGILYHLKNPYYALETLSKHARYCLISTTISDCLPGLYETVTGTSLAYLADIYEINHDSTNYWIFSDAGFRRLLKRCNWEICDYLLTSDSLTPGQIAGQRAFCLVRSRFADRGVNVLFGKGWHPIEEGGWRWTEREFSVRLESAREVDANQLRMQLFVSEQLLTAFGAITLHAVVNGIELPAEHYSQTGRHKYTRTLPVSTAKGDVRIDFSLDHALPPDAVDRRERAIVVCSLEAGN